MSYTLKVDDRVTSISYLSPSIPIGTIGKVISITPLWLDGILRAEVVFNTHNAATDIIVVYACGSSLVNLLSLVEALKHET